MKMPLHICVFLFNFERLKAPSASAGARKARASAVNLIIYFCCSQLRAGGDFSPEGNTGAALGAHCAAARAGAREAVCTRRCLRQGQPRSAAARNEKHAPNRPRAGSTAGKGYGNHLYKYAFSSPQKQKSKSQQLGRVGSSPKAG